MLSISFYEVFVPGTWEEGGWIEGLPDGRGIRHYDESDSDIHVRVVPSKGLIQLLDEKDNSEWVEYDVAEAERLEITYGNATITILFTKRVIDDDDPHKDVYGNIYEYSALILCQ